MSGVAAQGLRDELGGRPDPDFVIDLPPGWARRDADAATRAAMEADLAARMLQLQRPDLLAQSRLLLRDAFATLEQNRAIAFYAPIEPRDDMLLLPGSIIASIRSGEGEITLDAMVQHAIRSYGAQPLLGDPRIVRFERERVEALQGERFVSTAIVYVSPIPGTRRRRALQLTASFARPVDVPADDVGARRMRALFDACVSTLRWVPPHA